VIAILRKLVRYELRLWLSLFRWIVRRPMVSGPGATAYGYAGLMTPILIAFIAVSAIEVPIVHMLLPWRTVQLIATSLGVYGLVWMVGLLAGVRVRPHVVSDEGLRIRHSLSVDVMLPWEAVATVRKRGRDLPGRTVQIDRDGDGPVLQIGVMKQTNVDVTLHDPTTVTLPKGAETIGEVRFYADDPDALVASVRRHLAAAEKPTR